MILHDLSEVRGQRARLMLNTTGLQAGLGSFPAYLPSSCLLNLPWSELTVQEMSSVQDFLGLSYLFFFFQMETEIMTLLPRQNVSQELSLRHSGWKLS